MVSKITKYLIKTGKITISARIKVYTTINFAIIEAYWFIRKRIAVKELDFFLIYDIKYRMGGELERADE
jgi:hypothetical protein